MKYLLKVKVFFLIFCIIFNTEALAKDRLLPIPKPSVDEAIKIQTAKKKEIYPKKKPSKKILKSDTQEKIDEKISEISDEIEKKEEVFIYPQKKTYNLQEKNRQSCRQI
tara:strand:- start:430 stop:756 length:327 start_codon:yes stop_codon:yes gene_type:complete